MSSSTEQLEITLDITIYVSKKYIVQKKSEEPEEKKTTNSLQLRHYGVENTKIVRLRVNFQTSWRGFMQIFASIMTTTRSKLSTQSAY